MLLDSRHDSYDYAEHGLMIEIRKEEAQDREDIRDLITAAFENGPEATLVDSLRAACSDYLPLRCA